MLSLVPVIFTLQTLYNRPAGRVHLIEHLLDLLRRPGDEVVAYPDRRVADLGGIYDVSFSLELAPLRLRHRRISPRDEGMRRRVEDCPGKAHRGSPPAAVVEHAHQLVVGHPITLLLAV